MMTNQHLAIGDRLSAIRAARPAFTLIELLCVLFVISLLSALLLPALAAAKERGRQTSCLSNLRQLAFAWRFYSDDHGRLVSNGYIVANGNRRTPLWVQGYLNHGASPDATNTALLSDARFALFAPYLPSPRIYRCASDRKSFRILDSQAPKVRSYSLNGFLGWNFADGSNPPGLVALKESGIARPAQILNFLDVRADSICWPFFGINGIDNFFMYPAAYHGAAANLSFADGHSERHAWRDARTIKPIPQDWHGHSADSPGNADLAYLRKCATDRFGRFPPPF